MRSIEQGTTSPLVSIIMPAFNAEAHITESIQSILRQTYTNFELIIIDDKSTDKTAIIAATYANNDSRVKLITNKRSKGASGARNSGIVIADGDWIAFLDSDDIWFDVLEQKVRAVTEEYPDCDMISTDYDFWFPGENIRISKVDDNKVWNKHFGYSNESSLPIEIKNPIDAFMDTVLTNTNVVMVRAQIVHIIGGFDETIRVYEDIHMWLLLASHSQSFVYLPVCGALYRQHEGSLSDVVDDPIEMYAPPVFSKLLNEAQFQDYKYILRRKIIQHIQLNTYWYRNNNKKWKAFKSACSGLRWGWMSTSIWRNLLAASLLR